MYSPGDKYKPLKQVILEWVVTNGSLPGFEERLQSTKSMWKVVGPEGMIVYRGQGHTKPGIPNRGDPTTLTDGVRPIIATSKSMDIAKHYMGTECCLFEIQVAPGVRYLDAKGSFTFQNNDPLTKKQQPFITQVSNETIDKVLDLVAPMSDSYWLKKAIAEGNGRNAVRSVFLKRVHEEDEILLDGSQGGFVVTPHMFKAKYVRKGRGRTFRTKALRRNKKNGHRLTRKSKDRRHR